jgi:hypothetical protein
LGKSDEGRGLARFFDTGARSTGNTYPGDDDDYNRRRRSPAVDDEGDADGLGLEDVDEKLQGADIGTFSSHLAAEVDAGFEVNREIMF